MRIDEFQLLNYMNLKFIKTKVNFDFPGVLF